MTDLPKTNMPSDIKRITYLNMKSSGYENPKTIDEFLKLSGMVIGAYVLYAVLLSFILLMKFFTLFVALRMLTVLFFTGSMLYVFYEVMLNHVLIKPAVTFEIDPSVTYLITLGVLVVSLDFILKTFNESKGILYMASVYHQQRKIQ